jgi:hypothetical protein
MRKIVKSQPRGDRATWDPSPSKYDWLIAKAKEVPAATTIVVYPC